MNLGIWDSRIQSSLFCSKSKIKFTKDTDENVFMGFDVYGRNAIFSIMTYSKAPSIYSFLYPTNINWAPLSAKNINEYMAGDRPGSSRPWWERRGCWPGKTHRWWLLGHAGRWGVMGMRARGDSARGLAGGGWRGPWSRQRPRRHRVAPSLGHSRAAWWGGGH